MEKVILVNDFMNIVEDKITKLRNLKHNWEESKKEEVEYSLIFQSSHGERSKFRQQFYPPYFKTNDCLVSAPIIDDYKTKLPYYGSIRPHWSEKNLHTLKLAVKRCLIYVEEQKVNEKLENLQSENGKLMEKVCNYPVIVKAEVNPYNVQAWKKNTLEGIKEKSLKNLTEGKNIDWTLVVSLLYKKGIKDVTEDECATVWKLLEEKARTEEKWTPTLQKKLQKEISKYKTKSVVNDVIEENLNIFGKDWDTIAEKLGPGFTGYECFLVYKKISKVIPKLEDSQLDHKILINAEKFNYDLKETTIDLNKQGFLISTYELYVRFREIFPFFLKNDFELAEDCIIILMLEKFKTERNNHCLIASIGKCIPWRTTEELAKRIYTLFNYACGRWTIEEDRFLLEMVNNSSISSGVDWSNIAKAYGQSSKNRKNIRTRYLLLKKELTNTTLENYHKYYYQFYHPRGSSSILKFTLDSLQTLENTPVINFKGFHMQTPPENNEIELYLQSLDRNLYRSAIENLDNIISWGNIFKEKEIIRQNELNQAALFKERSKFYPDSAESLASALALRSINLKDRNKLKKMNEFHNLIYNYYDLYLGRRHCRKTSPRNFLPSKEFLISLPQIQDIIEPENSEQNQSIDSPENQSDIKDCFNEPKRPRITSKSRGGRKSGRISKMRSILAKDNWRRRKQQQENCDESDHNESPYEENKKSESTSANKNLIIIDGGFKNDFAKEEPETEIFDAANNRANNENKNNEYDSLANPEILVDISELNNIL